MRRLIPLFLLSVLALPSGAHAIFDDIDALEGELGTSSSAAAGASTGLEELLSKLAVEPKPTFADVPFDSWFHTYVQAVAEWKIAEGYRDAAGRLTGNFGPADAVTVAQALKISLVSAKVDITRCPAGVRHPGASGHWAYAYVACAEERHMRLFEADFPVLDRPATRAEVLTLLFDAFGEDVPPFHASFEDSVGHRYEADIAYANFRGVVSGDTDWQGNPLGTFRPNEPINRAEVAKIIVEQLRAFITQDGSGAEVRDIIVSDYNFTPSLTRVKKGTFVTLRFRTTGMHTFTVPGLGLNFLLVQPMQEFSFIPDRVGSYPFQCAVQGHKELGMEGIIIVED